MSYVIKVQTKLVHTLLIEIYLKRQVLKMAVALRLGLVTWITFMLYTQLRHIVRWFLLDKTVELRNAAAL